MSHRPLFLETGRRERVLAHLSAGEPTAVATFAACEEVTTRSPRDLPADASGRDPVAVYVSCAAVVANVRRDPLLASSALDLLLETTRPWTRGNLTLGGWALTASILADACFDLLDRRRQLALAALLVDLVNGQKEVEHHQGNPHVVTNNHWAVSHAGALLAALSAHGRDSDSAGHTWDLDEEVEWAASRLKPFLMHHGDWGLYHEGLGYALYPASFWLPATLALRNARQVDWRREFPFITRMGVAIYAAAVNRPKRSDNEQPVSGVGMKLSWNDDGLTWPGGPPAVLMTHFADERYRGGLRTMYDRLNGINGSRDFCPDFCGRFFAFFHYPYDTAPDNPDTVLPRHLCDSRQGLAIFRNRYRDADDALLGCHARATFVGGHVHDDAGSIRLMALGHDWILGGGQARGEAIYQSVVLPLDDERPDPPGCGAVLIDEPHAGGGVFAMDLRKASVGYHERYVSVDYSQSNGCDVALAILDLVDDHRERRWQWNLTFEPGLRLALHDDRLGFELRGDDDAVLNARFLGAQPTLLEPAEVPESKRTFQGGGSSRYPPRPMVHAEFDFAPNLAIYVVMAIRRGPAPVIALREGVSVTIDGKPWNRPFGAAIPERYRLGASGGMCRFPAGVTSYRARAG
jgi:hypothetical protein